jgi:ABC-type oligopeptide transport system substrate-binding subunit
VRPINSYRTKRLKNIAAKLADGLVKHDTVALSKLLSADGVVVSPSGIQNGGQAIQQSYEQLFRRLDIKQYTHTVEQLQEAGTNRAYGVGHRNEMSVLAGKADPIHLGGYWSTLYEKQGNGWMITLNSWSLAPPSRRPFNQRQNERIAIPIAPELRQCAASIG